MHSASAPQRAGAAAPPSAAPPGEPCSWAGTTAPAQPGRLAGGLCSPVLRSPATVTGFSRALCSVTPASVTVPFTPLGWGGATVPGDKGEEGTEAEGQREGSAPRLCKAETPLGAGREQRRAQVSQAHKPSMCAFPTQGLRADSLWGTAAKRDPNKSQRQSHAPGAERRARRQLCLCFSTVTRRKRQGHLPGRLHMKWVNAERTQQCLTATPAVKGARRYTPDRTETDGCCPGTQLQLGCSSAQVRRSHGLAGQATGRGKLQAVQRPVPYARRFKECPTGSPAVWASGGRGPRLLSELPLRFCGRGAHVCPVSPARPREPASEGEERARGSRVGLGRRVLCPTPWVPLNPSTAHRPPALTFRKEAPVSSMTAAASRAPRSPAPVLPANVP